VNIPELPYWRFELDRPELVKCGGCDRRVIEAELSPSGHCERCVARGQDDKRELAAEAGRKP